MMPDLFEIESQQAQRRDTHRDSPNVASEIPSPPRSVPPGQCTLAQAVCGRTVVVLAVRGDDALAQRLADQGLWRGVAVDLITTAPGGDPLLFRLHGYRLALRRDEAERVLVEPAEGPNA
jgi:ferrous iron transport protein A